MNITMELGFNLLVTLDTRVYTILPYGFHFLTIKLSLVTHTLWHLDSVYTKCHVIFSLLHKAVKNWLNQNGRLWSKNCSYSFFLTFSLLIKSGYISPSYTHLPLPRIIGAKPSPRFNEVVLELVREKKRLKQTPLCDVHISSLPLPRSLPFLNY